MEQSTTASDLSSTEPSQQPRRGPQGRIVPACDICHQKKIRCDRRDPCANCTLSNRSCVRRRQRQMPRRRLDSNASSQQDQMSKVLERMSRLEESFRRPQQPNVSGTDSQLPRSSGAASASSPDTQDTHNDSQSERAQNEMVSPPGAPSSLGTSLGMGQQAMSISSIDHNQAKSPVEDIESGISPEDRELAEVDLRRYLSPNLEARGAVDADKHELLMSALSLAKQMPISEQRSWELEKSHVSYLNFYQSNLYPSADFLCLMLNESPKNTSTNYYFELNANGSIIAFEMMAQALLDCSVHGETRVLYIICVNYMAYSYLTALDSDERSPLRKELARAARDKYRANVNMALHHLDTRPRPDPILLQALISATMIMQDAGNMQKSWQLNRAACRVAASLSGSWIAEHQRFDRPEDIFELRLNFMKCYIYDRALSANINHPACGVEVDLDTSILNPEKPSHAMLLIMVETAQVHNIINTETRKFGTRGDIDLKRMRGQIRRMQDIMVRAEEFRSAPEASNDRYLRFEWVTIDFLYYSTMTSVMRLSTDDNRHTIQACLQHSRDSLSALKRMIEIASAPSPFRNKCLTSIAWLVPLFTLRPVFFLFRRVVATSDALDLKLIQDIGSGLGVFSETHHSVRIVEQLCSSLIDLYAKFAEKVIYKRREPNANHDLMLHPEAMSENVTAQNQTHVPWLPAVPSFSPPEMMFREDFFNPTLGDVLAEDPFWDSVSWQPYVDESDLNL